MHSLREIEAGVKDGSAKEGIATKQGRGGDLVVSVTSKPMFPSSVPLVLHVA